MNTAALALFCALLALPHRTDAGAKSVYFIGPNGETAVETLLGGKLSDKERNRWKADKKVYRYHVFLAVTQSAAAQNLKKARALELELYRKLRWPSGGTGSVLDLSLLAALEITRLEIPPFYKDALQKIHAAQTPPAFAKSNAAFAFWLAARDKEESSTAAAVTALIASWRDARTQSVSDAFPVKKLFDILNSETQESKASAAALSGWTRSLRKDCETYFGRKFPAAGPESAGKTGKTAGTRDKKTKKTR